MLNRGGVGSAGPRPRWLKWVALGVIALWILFGAPLQAQSAQPVKGAGDFSGAPALSSGSYSDTIRLREELFYGVELVEGKKVRVVANILGQPGGPQDPTIAAQLRIYGPLRDLTGAGELGNFTGAATSKLKVAGERLSPENFTFESPGTYYFSLRLFELVGEERDSSLNGLEYETRFRVTIAGSAVEPSPTVTVAPSAEPSPTETDAAAPPASTSGAGDDPPYVRVFLLTFLVGLVAGFAIVLFRGFSRRAPRARSM